MIKNCSERILTQTIKIGAADGVGKHLSTKKIAAACHISEGTVFLHFKNKPELLYNAFLSIDQKIAVALKDCQFNPMDFDGSIRRLWDTYMSYLLSHPEESRYYLLYRNSQYYMPYTHHTQDHYYMDFLNTVNKIIDSTAFYGKFDYSVLWVTIIENSLRFAGLISGGVVKDTPENRDFIYNIIFSYILQSLKNPGISKGGAPHA